jgi:hypothetical protein
MRLLPAVTSSAGSFCFKLGSGAWLKLYLLVQILHKTLAQNFILVNGGNQDVLQ